ncbi:unnamed protein product [Allacma fusca]|uniref:DNA damage-inducible protein 1 n=1 Tax=Allacma fusca TaxID=39272 RepID=A0A8J2L9P2_9HEXA|nr:unnamed protein product [Allacma fusca]
MRLRLKQEQDLSKGSAAVVNGVCLKPVVLNKVASGRDSSSCSPSLQTLEFPLVLPFLVDTIIVHELRESAGPEIFEEGKVKEQDENHIESGISSNEILIVHNGRPLTDDKKSLKDLGLQDGDVVIMQQHHRQSSASIPPSMNTSQFGFGLPAPPPATATGTQSQRPSTAGLPQFDFSGIQVPGRSQSQTQVQAPRKNNYPNLDDPAVLRDILLNDPEQLAMLEQNNPPLATALKSGDFETFSKQIRQLQQVRHERETQRLRLLSADPFDLEAQRLIAEEIRQKNIDANMEAAMEFNPESFGTVVMLYINCKVNGHPVKAFIDSGAQTTIMSTECAERCAIMRLVDTRFSGIAKGVGTQKIIGRIHMVQIQIGNDFLTSSFSILEDQKMDMLLGLDMLKRHQCVIDLNRNILVIGTTKTETPFLPESELPELARLTTSQSTLAEERALSDLGGEDAGLARALEESIRAHAGTSSTRPSTENTPQVPADNFSEALVQEIVKIGFARDQVLFELRRFNGDKTQAIAALFAKSLSFKR